MYYVFVKKIHLQYEHTKQKKIGIIYSHITNARGLPYRENTQKSNIKPKRSSVVEMFSHLREINVIKN